MSNPAFAHIRDDSIPPAALDLSGAWEFKATTEAAWSPAQAPGSVYSDLLRAGRLSDPYDRDNELRVQWVAQRDWEYRRDFHVDSSFLQHDRVLLECLGLDTITELYLNRAPLAETQNMFVEHEFNVKRLLHFFAPFKFVRWPDPGLRYAVTTPDGRPLVTVSAQRFAAFVELGLEGGYARFSDNYFHLLPGETKELRLLEATLPAGEIPGRLYARSLVDTYR